MGRPLFRTRSGRAYNSSIEEFLASRTATSLRGKVDLILTSPPFPLLHPKKYGNRVGDDYLEWITSLAAGLTPMLRASGSLVIEIGNSWDRGQPTMSTYPIRSLLGIADRCNLNVCQQFVWHNSAKLPGPAEWVTKRRVRVTDSFTHIWWYSPSTNPKANNRNVLVPYSEGMKSLLSRGTYNSGARPSGHTISDRGFLTDNSGAIPRSFLDEDAIRNDEQMTASSSLVCSNTATDKNYVQWCRSEGLQPHPATMPAALCSFFIKFLTEPGDLVLDPFAGSCTTGRVASDLGRNWICVEPNTDYLRGAQGRFKDVS